MQPEATALLWDVRHAAERIARQLHIAPNTVRNHVQRILTKLGATSRLEAVAIARRDGLLDE